MSQKVEVVQERKYGIPVGTSNVFEISKFLVELRDTSCPGCKTGYKSVANKVIDGKSFPVPVFCTCVPYITSEDKDGNLVVVYKGARELWPGRKRPEQYIQNDLQRQLEFSRAKQNLSDARGQSKAHDGVTQGKYVLGTLSTAEKQELGAELVKSLQPKFMKEGEPSEVVGVKAFVKTQATRNVPMRNKEGHIIMVDNAMANHMQAHGLAVPERPEEKPATAPAAAAPPAVSKSVQKRVKAQAAPAPVSAPVAVAPAAKKKGRPLGSKNKPKTPKE